MFEPRPDLGTQEQLNPHLPRCIAKPIGIILFCPGLNIIFSSMHALRSKPAEPDVSYFGKGIDLL
jgi:hypothetical protein